MATNDDGIERVIEKEAQGVLWLPKVERALYSDYWLFILVFTV